MKTFDIQAYLDWCERAAIELMLDREYPVLVLGPSRHWPYGIYETPHEINLDIKAELCYYKKMAQ